MMIIKNKEAHWHDLSSVSIIKCRVCLSWACSYYNVILDDDAAVVVQVFFTTESLLLMMGITVV